MATYHKVVSGECLSCIAYKYGFTDYMLIWNQAANAPLRQKRKDPNVLFPGDMLYVPDKQSKEDYRNTGQRHDYQIPTGERTLRLAVEDANFERLVNTSYVLTADNQVFTGSTDGDGILEITLPLSATQGALTIAGLRWSLLIGYLNPIEFALDGGISGIQARLSNLGYTPGPIDGINGPLTSAAVKAFQADYPPLAVDGICGPLTSAKLIEIHGC